VGGFAVTHPLHKYLREEVLPGPFCPGCGNGLVLGALLRAVARAGHGSLQDFVFVSGIGCAAWIPSPHLKADSLHVAHGRAIPTAIGVKLHRPELNVVVVGGDGDIAGIGGNHLLHAARRNADIFVLMANNLVYAMTGGQVGPATPHGLPTSTTPYGNPEQPMDTAAVVAAAGANYAARWTVAHGRELERAIGKALSKRGFRYVEALSQCPARVVGKLRMEPVAFLRWLKERSVPRAEGGEADLGERFFVGEYADRDRPGLGEALAGLRPTGSAR
jgi:2-oxoglutarate ferredoxin oxidoreductase subunit beta